MEEENESWDTTAEKVKHVLKEKLGLAAEPHIVKVLNAPFVSVGLLLVPEDALARLSVGFATGDKRT